jgi:hypothetical protein
MTSRDVHLEALTATQQRILQACAGTTSSWGTYLAGGAAVALQLGHRRSDDFDWFGPRAVPPDDLLRDVRKLGTTIEVDQNNEGTFLGRVDGVKFSVFRYRYPLLEQPLSVEGSSVASPRDIAAMKLLAITQRAVRRDYVDIHALLTQGGMSLEAMVYAFHQKFPTGDPAGVVRALNYVGDVDKGIMPEMLNRTTWEKVKKDLARAMEGFDLARALSDPHPVRASGRSR